ncbi:AraC family transcriptional regulator [Rhizobium alvei]|uniref:AraC family transcriptional regulator n=1 Tax=Rhizobium alvei TaxID=1132659 RepID=A0ABT8YMT3_9HYPH|nr:AraC family transcriptional regulator [Rhizobium alvei]MDO6965044.1 AraC family transcriptional regulator [Rhizobium alvei]
MIDAIARPLQHHGLVDTRAVDEARDAIGRIFCPHFLSVNGRSHDGFHAVHNAVEQPGYSVNFVAYGAEVEIDPGELSDFFLLQLPVQGAASVRCGTRIAETSAGQCGSLLSPTLASRMVWKAGCEKLIVLMRRSVVEDFYETLTHRARGPIEFDPAIDLTSSVGRSIFSHTRMMFEAAEGGAALPDTYRTMLRDGLISLLLTGLANNGASLLGQASSDVGSAPVRKAEDYIRAHAIENISMADIAEAAGIPLRTLQEAYRKALGRTLSDGVQLARLETLRRLLLKPSATLSVADAVLASGFGHLGRAASAYREAFGESPSETLRRVRGR